MDLPEPVRTRAARPQLVIAHLQQVMHRLNPGDRLPSETALSKQLKVSRNTVRDALAALERDGMVVRQHGLGTFKSQPRQHLQASLNRMLPIPEVIRASGYTPQVDAWTRRTGIADAETAQDLGLPAGTSVEWLDLLYRADDIPAVQVSYALHPRVTAHLADWPGFSPTAGVVRFLSQHYPDPLSHTSTRIAAVNADEHIAGVLQLHRGAALLRFVTVGIAVSGDPLYRNVSYQSGDLLDVHILRPARSEAP